MSTLQTEKADLKVAPKATRPALTGRGRNPELEAALGARIRAARIAARMSQTALGAAVDVSFQQVQKYERGTDRVAASTLQAFAAALGVHPGSFYGDDMPAPSGSIPELKTAMRIAERIQCVRSPMVLRRLLALLELLAEANDAEAQCGPPTPATRPSDHAPPSRLCTTGGTDSLRRSRMPRRSGEVGV